MRLNPGVHKSIRIIASMPPAAARIAVEPGRPFPWRPPVRLVGLLELVRRRTPVHV